jgi:hypothetical protein
MTPGRSGHRLEEEAVAKLDVPVVAIRGERKHPSYITLPVIPRSGPGLAEEAR